MAKIPQTQRQVATSGALAGGFISPSVARTGEEMVGRAIEGFGGQIGKIGENLARIEAQKKAIQDKSSLARAKFEEDEFVRGLENEMRSKAYSSADELQQDRAGFVDQLDRFRAMQAERMSPEAFGAYQEWSMIDADSKIRRVDGTLFNRQVDLGKAEAGTALGKAFATVYEPTATLAQKQSALRSVAEIREGYKEYFTEGEMEQLSISAEYQALITNGGTKKEAYELVEEAVEAGELTPEQSRSMIADIDGFWSGHAKREDLRVKQTTEQAYQSLIPAMMSGEISYQMIDSSSLPKEDKLKFKKFIKGISKPAPTQNSTSGVSNVHNLIYKANTKQISPQEAYDALLEMRFSSKKDVITDDMFEMALKRVDDPYPKFVSDTVNSVITANVGRKMSKNEAEAVESFMQWVDDIQTSDKKLPLNNSFYKNANEVMNQLLVAKGSFYDLGQILERGGRRVQVVGFDRDGEPVVEFID